MKLGKLLNVTAKALLILAFVIIWTLNPETVAGKGMNLRAPFYIGAIMLWPLLRTYKKTLSYSHISDLLITLPFLFDTYGNVFGLFDSFVYYDDLVHGLNWVCFVWAFQNFHYRRAHNKLDSWFTGTCFGTFVIVVWEVLEWALSVDGFGVVGNLRLSYADTIGDLVTSTTGGAIGSYLGIKLNHFIDHS